MQTTPRPMPIAKLILPSASLTSCVFGAFVRDTRGCNLSVDQRFNHYGASPLCSISLFFDGRCHLLEYADPICAPDTAPLVPQFCFSGPHQQPKTSWNANDVYVMMVVFYPDAFARLTGIELTNYLNRTVPLDEVLPDDLHQLFMNAFKTGDAEIAFSIMQEALAPIWQKTRPSDSIYKQRVADWCKSLAIRATLSQPVKSTRQIQRDLRTWSGQSLSKLRGYARGERAFKAALAARATGDLDLAQLSVDQGYSDQSHFSRQVRQITGFSPADFMKHYDEDEAFWLFRLTGGTL